MPVKPSYPNKPQLFILIIGSAFMAAVILVFLIEAMKPGVLNPEQVETELGISTIGVIPHITNHDPQNYILEKPHSIYGESLNSIKTSLMLSSPDEPVKAIQITSSIPEEGKSTVALSFSRLLAMSGKKVILIDADLRRASLESKLGIPVSRKGLTDLIIAEDTEFSDCVVKDEKSDLFIMPKGVAEYVNATDIFSSRRMNAIINSLKKQFDYVIFDTPPVLAVPDARILGQLVDKTIVVIRWNKTPVKVAKAALNQLNTDDVDVAGCVLQQVNLKKYGRYGYGNSGYYYHYGKYGKYYTS
jgi:capsular exopolysaccharide synthesis family protein